MTPAQAFVDTLPSAEPVEGGEPREGARRRRRGRGGRDRDESRQGEAGLPGEQGDAPAFNALSESASSDAPELATAQAEGEAPPSADNAERDGRRRGRGRDRTRRERGPDEGASAADDANAVAPGEAVALHAVDSEPVAPFVMNELAPQVAAEAEPVNAAAAVAAPASVFTPPPVAAPAPVAAVATVAAVVATVAPVATVVAPEAAAEPFVLPMDQLQGVAETAGLQWVNSDADKMRASREAMANEPAPARVSREVKAVVAVDDGPLVLVETRKDLSQFKLPFESADNASRPAS